MSVAVALCVVLVAVVLAAGCAERIPTGFIEPSYVPDHDIVVIKLAADGSLEWEKTIDSGRDDTASIIIPGSDGSVLVPAIYGNRGNMRLSSDGTIVWEKKYGGSGCLMDALSPLQEGGFISASSGNGEVCKIDPDGNLIWNRITIGFDSVHSVIETDDGGFLVGGSLWKSIIAGDSVQNYRNVNVCNATLVRLDPDGQMTWQRDYGTDGYQAIYSILETKDGQSYVGLFGKNDELYLVHLDHDGQMISGSSIGFFTKEPLPEMKKVKDGYSVLFFDNTKSAMETVHLDADRKITNRGTLAGTARSIIIITDDSGFLSVALQYTSRKPPNAVGTGSSYNAVEVTKFDSSGTRLWNATPIAFCNPPAVTNFDLKCVVQTSDGGYALLGERDNFWKC